MEYLVSPTDASARFECCFLGGKCECQGVNACAHACAQCSELCGAQFCSPTRMDPMSNL